MKNLFSIYETNVSHRKKCQNLFFQCLYVPSNYQVFKKDKYSKWCYSVFGKTFGIYSLLYNFIL